VASSRRTQTDRSPDRLKTVPVAEKLVGLANLAVAHHRAGRFAEAIDQYRRFLSLKSDVPEIHNNLGRALAELGRLEEAAASFRRAVDLKPDNPEALCNWGFALAELERFDEAEAKYRSAIAVSSGFAGAYNNLGQLLKETGRFAEARQATEHAISLAPRNVAYYENLGAVRSFTAGDSYVTALEAIAADVTSLSATDCVHLHFALAKAHEDTGQPENAFQQLLTANALKRRHIAYDEATTLDRMVRIRELINRNFIEAHRSGGDPSQLPVFIVGMPRSGTTLIEQILASHPQVFGAGELHLFDQAAGSVRDVMPGRPEFPEMMSDMWAKHFRTLAAFYLERLKQRAPGAARITDKMTTNFLFAGLIHLALPNAVIIHAVRNPIDTCVSCFSLNFTRGMMHTYDLAELGRYYRQYQAVMAHWHDVLPPGRILDVHYEELVSDPEGVARRIIAHCGLGWDTRCLDFHRTERSVRTASAVQVRQPVYKSSMGRWRRYQNFLGPLLAELGTRTAQSVHAVSNLKEDQHA
jgi:Flp pilus assembly protein TadD